MGKPISAEETLFRQRLLSCSGFYKDKLDGLWGSNTDAAEQAFFAEAEKIAKAEGRFDKRSESNILSLRIDVQPLARKSLKKIIAAGLDARIISGARTYAEQNKLYRQGRFGNPPPKVTNARGGQSNHNFGLAWDIGLFEGGKYLVNSAPYIAAAKHGKIKDVGWGGDWNSFKDPPHYYASAVDGKISELRQRFESGCR